MGEAPSSALEARGGVRSRTARWRDLLQEARELGAGELAFRVRWEVALRSGWMARAERSPPPAPWGPARLVGLLPFAPPDRVAAAMSGRIAGAALSALAGRARDAARGRVRCFGRWTADFGDPVDWHLNPVERRRWPATAHWSEILKDTAAVGDVKLTWEIGRFPHAFELSRAAALGQLGAADAAAALARHITAFVRENPYGRGVHWASGQEIVIRLVAWLFAAHVLGDVPAMRDALPAISRHLHDGAVHLERYFDYVRKSVTNNHLISEAFGLYLAGTLVPEAPRARRWADLGLAVLTEQAERQFDPDGAYLMPSHCYHRAALQTYLLAYALRRREGEEVPAPWLGAMERSLDFLVAHQDPLDGRLPNFGSNDGALPAILSTCDRSDFRPVLQALSLAARGERRYEAGPWDEEAAWLLGPAALDAPMRARPRRSVSFGRAGFHVLRGDDQATFAAFRCGTLRHRFAHMDMLHLDVFWRGENVLVDGGTFLYNGPAEWHRHFTSSASHNTVTVDGHEQMVHHRRFKLLYPPRARLLRFEDRGAFTLVEGEHDGFRRHAGACVHRRAVLHVKDALWVVIDRVQGTGVHSARLHWLGGPFPHAYDARTGTLELRTPSGPFSVTVLDAEGRPLSGDVVTGEDGPPRGWSSRCYAEKVPAPSLAVVRRSRAPLELVSILGESAPIVEVSGDRWRVVAGPEVRFRICDGRFEEIQVGRARTTQA